MGFGSYERCGNVLLESLLICCDGLMWFAEGIVWVTGSGLGGIISSSKCEPHAAFRWTKSDSDGICDVRFVFIEDSSRDPRDLCAIQFIHRRSIQSSIQIPLLVPPFRVPSTPFLVPTLLLFATLPTAFLDPFLCFLFSLSSASYRECRGSASPSTYPPIFRLS